MLTSGISAPPIYFDILVYYTEICWCTMLYDVTRHHCIYSYMSKYEKISHDIIAYTRICQNMKWYLYIYSYIRVYRIWRCMVVYACLWWYILLKQSIYHHIQVYTFETKYIPSYTMPKLWHEMFMDLYNLTYVYILWPNDSFPAAPPRLARLKAANLLRPLFWFKALKFKHYGI